MAFRRGFVALVTLLSTHNVLAQDAHKSGITVQKADLTVPSRYSSYKDAVVDMFNASYSAYRTYAWGHDDLSPNSLSYSDPLGGWGASIADALDTMYIMGFDDYFQEALNYTGTIDFNQSNTPSSPVSVFETSIRYVGGYLTAYEISDYKYPILVEKARQVADKLVFGFTGSSPIPYNYIDFSTNEPQNYATNVAQAGTLTLEYSRLSQYTGNDTYRQLAENAVRWMINLTDPLPGLPGQVIDPSSGQFVAPLYITWGGGTDSYLEYLIKYARLTNNNDPIFVDTWARAVDSSIKTLKRTSTIDGWTYLADWDQGTIIHVGSHLECFNAGNWLLGGALLKNSTITEVGLALNEACWNTYASTETRIGPEIFYYMSLDGNYTGNGSPTSEQLAFYAEHGFYIGTADYIQRPEVLESNFYAWRVTGHTKYLDRAASAIKSFNNYLNATVAYAGLNDVDDTTAGQIDDMQSFWFAEVLKYLYLTFDDPNNFSLDDYVFNTEGHPFKAPASLSSYGSGQLTFPGIDSVPVVSPTATGAFPAFSSDPSLPTQLVDLLHL